MLFTEIKDLKEHISVDLAQKLGTVKPSITRAEKKYLVKILGKDLYETLASKQQENTLSDHESALLMQCLPALAYLSYYLGLPTQNTRFTDSGLHTSSSPDKERLPKWHYDELRLSLLHQGHDDIDTLYQYMEAATDADWFEDWQESSAFSQFKQLFIQSATQFSEHVNINESRWLYTQMKATIKNCELLYLKPSLGNAFFDELKTNIKEGLSEEEESIMPLLQNALAHFSYSSALVDPLFRQELVNTGTLKNDAINATGSANNNSAFESLAKDYEAKGHLFMKMAVEEINAMASASVFTTFFESDKYKNPEPLPSEMPRFANDEAKGSFFF
jgi:hypothetical protein